MHDISLPLEFFAAVVTALYIVKLVVEIYGPYISGGEMSDEHVAGAVLVTPSAFEKRSLLNQSVAPRGVAC